MTKKDQHAAAQAFADRWQGKGYEKGESQTFWNELLSQIFGIENPSDWITFEEQVKLDRTAFIDGHIAKTHVLIEQKSLGKDLRAPIRQSNGEPRTPFQQAKRYAMELPYSKRPRWIVTCNFSDFLVYDMEQPHGEPEHIELKNLGKECYRLQFLVDTRAAHIQRELEISLKAGEIMAKIYDKILEQYVGGDAPRTEKKTKNRLVAAARAEDLHSLNMLCVRLVFCFYAEDAGVFGSKRQFGDYLRQLPASKIRGALLDLFRVLDTKTEERDRYLEPDLAAFPYVNGGLFSLEDRNIPQFTDEIKDLLVKTASDGFDWSGISPTIFGAIFESTLNPTTRRTGGMHYTSIENIHKVIDPLFFSELQREFEEIIEDAAGSRMLAKTTENRLSQLQDKLASLTFLDPACGSGNFLTETFVSLRRLENEIIKTLKRGQSVLGFDAEHSPVKVSIQQFFGIEVNDFAVTVAQTALWIAEHQMLLETQSIVQHELDYLPLKSHPNIRRGDALKLPWDEIEIVHDVVEVYARRTNLVPIPYPIIQTEETALCEPPGSYGNINLHTDELVINNPLKPNTLKVRYDYIIGNPPFVGYVYQSAEQKEGIRRTWNNKAKNMDYVTCWFKKAADYINMYGTKDGASTRCAFVSTNSICQGESAAALWKPLLEDCGLHIDFAHRTFRWESESEQMAHVHCVVVGFSKGESGRPKVLFDENGDAHEVSRINGYLMEADDIFVERRQKPLCDVPEMLKGSIPVDGGHLLMSQDEKEEFLSKYPECAPYVRAFLGAEEFLHNKPRFCLWLEGISPKELLKNPIIKNRVARVKAFRLASAKEATRKFAEFPSRFMEIRQPSGNYLLVPSTTSSMRKYVPIGFISNQAICGNANFVIPDATLYHFGILTSKVHNAWMRAVGGRLKNDYRYSKDIVYNSFPWCTPTNKQKEKIEQTAKDILDARALYPDSSLADLYDETAMPIELRKAHRENDKAVMAAYGFSAKMSESEIVTRLMAMYQELTMDN